MYTVDWILDPMEIVWCLYNSCKMKIYFDMLDREKVKKALRQAIRLRLWGAVRKSSQHDDITRCRIDQKERNFLERGWSEAVKKVADYSSSEPAGKVKYCTGDFLRKIPMSFTSPRAGLQPNASKHHLRELIRNVMMNVTNHCGLILLDSKKEEGNHGLFIL